ncbi:MAG: DNA polymerase III subunit gamma/tau [Bacteroidales bacterium]|nr:DNA polymerase III subunit gamma/tau [Bacteroidales bacterium]
MTQYIVSARKYRPSTFASVVGQEALTTTLKNAISVDKLAHAYLFCGPRGVGKTTCARIFAKTINCLNVTPDGEACNECESCVAFNEHRSYNIYELDAASNNSVDDIRQLVEQVRIPPQIGKYKVYIIDEVHMLSAQAFNAFLKTLEEPPHHAVFILATTEKHKILPTILSRCQIYDFHRIRVNDIVNHLQKVAEIEGYTAEPEALNIIALKADGGMRDALSIFDQVVSFTQGNITYDQVIRNLNVLDYEYYFRLTESLINNQVSDALLLFNDILNKGFEGSHFISGLASHFRDLLVSKDDVTLPLLEVGATIRNRYKEQAKTCLTSFLYEALNLCNNCDLKYRESKNKRLLVELTLIQLAQITMDGSTSERKKKSEQKLKPLSKENVRQEKNENKKQPPAQSVRSSNASDSQDSKSFSQREEPNFSIKKKEVEGGKKEAPLIDELPLSISIRKHGRTNPQTPLKTTNPTEEIILGDSEFTDEDLLDSWKEYTRKLPIEQKAFAMRMESATINRLDDVTFEMVVDNKIIEHDFESLKPSIERFIRKQLDNGGITMKVRVIEPEENKRPFSRMEKFQMMAEKNNALLKLRDEFDLDFY